MFFGDDHGGEAVVGRRDAYWASGRSAVTNSLLLSVLWAVGTFSADQNVQHWAEPRRSVGVGNSTIKLNEGEGTIKLTSYGQVNNIT